MPLKSIYVPQSDIDAAKRIAEKMTAHLPEGAIASADSVLSFSLIEGLHKYKVIWGETVPPADLPPSLD